HAVRAGRGAPLATIGAMAFAGRAPMAGGAAALVALTAVGLGAAASRATRGEAERNRQAAYLAQAPARRAALLASLVNPDNAYGRLRRAHYATGTAGDWDRLRAWNPRVAPVTRAGEAPGWAVTGAGFSALPIGDETRLPSDAELRALGESAFFR